MAKHTYPKVQLPQPVAITYKVIPSAPMMAFVLVYKVN
jgi:hypothetical protein